MQHTQITSRHCATCGRLTKFERHVTPLGGGDFILVLATLGLWLLLRALFKPAFRCSFCGRA